MQLNRVFREEKKFLINVEEFIKKSHQLEQVLIQDEHNGTNGYMIRSLYFDTVYDDDYFEKQAGWKVEGRFGCGVTIRTAIMQCWR